MVCFIQTVNECQPFWKWLLNQIHIIIANLNRHYINSLDKCLNTVILTNSGTFQSGQPCLVQMTSTVNVCHSVYTTARWGGATRDHHKQVSLHAAWSGLSSHKFYYHLQACFLTLFIVCSLARATPMDQYVEFWMCVYLIGWWARFVIYTENSHFTWALPYVTPLNETCSIAALRAGKPTKRVVKAYWRTKLGEP